MCYFTGSLKVCPKCGHKPITKYQTDPRFDTDTGKVYTVMCGNLFCDLAFSRIGVKQACKAWNNSTPVS